MGDESGGRLFLALEVDMLGLIYVCFVWVLSFLFFFFLEYGLFDAGGRNNKDEMD